MSISDSVSKSHLESALHPILDTKYGLTSPLPSWKKSTLKTHSIWRREKENGFGSLTANSGESIEATDKMELVAIIFKNILFLVV